jgi:methyl-accepting chemotaxis protein
VGLLLAWAISRSITRPIHRIIEGLSSSAGQVSSAASQISSASYQLAEGSGKQAAAIEETSSSLEEMSSMTKQNADSASQCKAVMQETRQIVGRVNDHMNGMAEAISKISMSSEQTVKIVKTIDEIAFQTNLLALNVAVEAARAGEAGAGFAVVADEVRNLAMRAAEAAKTTTDLIDNTIKAVKEGSGLMDLTKAAFDENIKISEKVDGLVSEIAAASQEQAQGIEQVSRAVSEMDKVTQQNSANAEESASASKEMSAQAERMKDFVTGLVSLAQGDGSGKRKKLSLPEPERRQSSIHLPAGGIERVRIEAGKRSGKTNEAHLSASTAGARKISAEELAPAEGGDLSDF